MKNVREKYVIILLFCICLCISLCYSPHPSTSKGCFTDLNSEYYQIQSNSSELGQNFSYNYGYKTTGLLFYSEISNLNLNLFNCFTLFFSVSGDKSNLDGINVAFNLDDTEITFIIDRLFQDNIVHNLTETFFYSGSFQGTKNISIVINAQSSFGQTGTITVLSYSFFDIIPIPDLYESDTPIPSIPNWFMFQGNAFSSKNKKVVTAFNHLNETNRFNLTLSFQTNRFDALEHVVRISINGEETEECSFRDGSYQQFHFTSSLTEGLNIVEIEFQISNSQDLINIYNIEIVGKAFCLLNHLPHNTFDYIYWEDQLNYTFDLSHFKPNSSESSFILNIDLHYGCLGKEINPSITCRLYSSKETIAIERITSEEQNGLVRIKKIKARTTHFQKNLTLHVSGVTTGEGIIFLLNTTTISIEPIPSIHNQTIVRTLVLEENVNSTEKSHSEISHKDFIFFDGHAVEKWRLSISFEILTEVNFNIGNLSLTIRINFQYPISWIISNEQKINESEIVYLYPRHSIIYFSISFHGNYGNVIFKDIKYSLSPEPENFDPLNNENQEENNSSLSIFNIGNYILLVNLAALGTLLFQMIRRLKIKRDIRNVERVTFHIERKLKLKRFYVSLLQLLVSIFMFAAALIFISFFLSNYRWLAYFVPAILCFASYYSIDFFKNKPTQDNASIKYKNIISEVIWDFINWAFIKNGRILRIGATLLTSGLFIVSPVTYIYSSKILNKITEDAFNLISYQLKGEIGFVTAQISCFISLVCCYFALVVVFNFAAYEDNLKKFSIVVLAFIPLHLVSFMNILSFLRANLLILGGLFLPFSLIACQLLAGLMIIILIFFISLKKASRLNITFFQLLRNGKFSIKNIELFGLMKSNYNTRTEMKSNKPENRRQQLKKILEKKVVINDTLALRRISFLSGIPTMLIVPLLEDILDEDPSFGILNRERRTFTLLEKDISETEEMLIKEDESVIKKLPNLSENTSELLVNLEETIENGYFIQSSEVLEKIQFCYITHDGFLKINPVLVDLIDDLKRGKRIKLCEITNGTHKEREIVFETIKNSYSSIRFLIKQFLFNLEDLINDINKKHKEYWDIWNINNSKFQKLTLNQREEYFECFSRYLYVEYTAGSIFTEDNFYRESGLFTGKSFDYYKNVSSLNGILVKYLSATLRGELAIIMVFLHSLLLMKNDLDVINATKFDVAAKQVSSFIQMKSLEASSMSMINFPITDYYNPFIRMEYSIENSNELSISGWIFRQPEEISYLDSIWSDKVPFKESEEEKILQAIKGDWKGLEGFYKNISTMDLAKIKTKMKRVYGSEYDSIELLYIYNKYYNKKSFSEFQTTIRNQIQVFPKKSRDWYSYFIYRNQMTFIQGKDLFDECLFVMMEVYQDDQGEERVRCVEDGQGNLFRKGLLEIESKSSYYKPAPYAVKYQEFGFTNNNVKLKGGGVYVHNEDLKAIINRFLDGQYDLCVSIDNRKSSLKQELKLKNEDFGNWNTKKNRSLALKYLKDNKFDILSKRIDRVETKTVVSGQKHLLRRIINAVEKNPQLVSSYDWYDKLTSKEADERNKHFVSFIDKLLKKHESYEGLKLEKEIVEYIVNYNSFMIYYNVLLFTSGFPVLTFNNKFLPYDFYLPQELNRKTKKITNMSTPTWRGITGGLTRLANSSLDLQCKIAIPTPDNDVQLVTLSRDSFQNPIKVYSSNNQEYSVFSMRIIEDGKENLIILNNGNWRLEEIQKVGNKEKVTLSDNEKIYGAAVLDENQSVISTFYAKKKLCDLLLIGGKQFDGLEYDAIISLLNRKKACRLTNDVKRTPFLNFLLVASNRNTGDKQLKSLAYPLIYQQSKMSESSTNRDKLVYRFRPSIAGVSYYTLNSLLGSSLDLSVAFGDETKFYDDVYWSSFKGSQKKMTALSRETKGKKNTVTKLIWGFHHAFTLLMCNHKKRGINRINQELYVKENKKHIAENFSFEKIDNLHHLREIRIPISSKRAVENKTYTWYGTTANSPFILLKDTNEFEPNETNYKKRHRAAVSFIKLIDEIAKELPKKIRETDTWLSLEKIRCRYSISEETQIDSIDWAKILLLMFPELLVAPRIPYSLRKNHLTEFDISRFDLKKIDIIELLKLFNRDYLRFSCHAPYNTFYNFVTYFLMGSWTIFRKGSSKSDINYPLDSWSHPDIIIIPFLRNWLQFLIFRGEKLNAYFHNPEKNLDLFDIPKLFSEQIISNEFFNIMSYSFEDIRRGKTIVDGILVEIPVYERMIWLLVKESQFTDTLSFGLHGYYQLVRKCTNFASKYDELNLIDSKKSEFLEAFSSFFDN